MDNARFQENRSAIIILSLMLGAFLYAWFFMLPQGIGLDESQSMWQASHTVGGLFYVVAQDVHVPLYHLLLHLWQIAFGNSVRAARLLSLLIYLPIIPLVYFLGKISFKKDLVGLFAAVLFTISPFANWYGSTIRMYGLLTLITVINQIFFVLIFQSREKARPAYWVGYFVSVLFGVYSHYFFFFIILAEIVFFFAYRPQFPKGALSRFLLIGIIVLILFSPWLMYVRSLGKFGANTSPKLSPPTTVDIFNTFSNFLFGFQTDPVNTAILSSWPLITLILFLALQKGTRVMPETVFFLVTALVPIAAAAALSHVITPFYLSRYFIGLMPSFCIAASWFFTLYPRTLSRVARTALVGAMAFSLRVQTASPASPIKEDYKDVAAYIETYATARDVIAVSAPFTIYPVEYYYRGPATLTTLPVWNRLEFGPIPTFSMGRLESDTASFSRYENLWLILSYDQGYEQQMRIYLDTHYERVSLAHFSPGLDVYEYRLRYNANATLANALTIAGSLPASSTLPAK